MYTNTLLLYTRCARMRYECVRRVHSPWDSTQELQLFKKNQTEADQKQQRSCIHMLQEVTYTNTASACT